MNGNGDQNQKFHPWQLLGTWLVPIAGHWVHLWHDPAEKSGNFFTTSAQVKVAGPEGVITINVNYAKLPGFHKFTELGNEDIEAAFALAKKVVEAAAQAELDKLQQPKIQLANTVDPLVQRNALKFPKRG